MKRSELERRIVQACLARYAEWKKRYPLGIHSSYGSPPTAKGCAVIRATEALATFDRDTKKRTVKRASARRS